MKRPMVILLSLGVVAIVVGTAVVGGRYLLRGPLEMATRKRRFDALVQTNDHRAVAEAAIAAIRAYTNAEFLGHQVTNLPPAIAALRPSYVVVYPDAVTIEFAGGFDHFGFRVEARPYVCEMSWYTERGQQQMLTIRGEPSVTAKRSQAVLSETNSTPGTAASGRSP